MPALSRLARLLPSSNSTAILSSYVHSSPSPQNAADIFRGEWSSRLPIESLESGSIDLFQDPRIEWAAEQLGGFEGKTVLDLGPLEGGHAFMFQRMGAAEVVSVEANTRAYLKCLVAKELLDLRRTRFLCGDFVEYLREGPRRFDVVNASGVLYHMQEPVELIALACGAGDAVNVWTHYYDEGLLRASPHLRGRLAAGVQAEHGGFRYTKHRQRYGQALGWKGFCGAGAEFSYWMSREDILGAFRHFGMTDVRVAFDEPGHQNGPSFALTASR